MNARIVLSVIVLMLSACNSDNGADVAVDAGVANGIGTSPSIEKSVVLPAPAFIMPCGLWKGATYDEAVVKANMGYPPDMLQFTLPDGLSCSDLIQFRDTFYPLNSEVFYAEDGGWRRAE